MSRIDITPAPDEYRVYSMGPGKESHSLLWSGPISSYVPHLLLLLSDLSVIDTEEYEYLRIRQHPQMTAKLYYCFAVVDGERRRGTLDYVYPVGRGNDDK